MRFLAASRWVCPFCLHEMAGGWQGATCPSCRRPQPPQYRRDARGLEPLPVQAIGWSGHGKSVFLAALTMLLSKLQVVWREYTWQPGSDETRQAIEEILRHLESGTLPPPTPVGTDLPFLLLLGGMGRWGGRALVYRDCAGELFNTLSIPVEQVPFLLKAKTVFLIASPEDLAERRERTIDMLLQRFLATLYEHRIDLAKERRRLVVVLTKGDLIRDLSPELRGYLCEDDTWRILEEGSPGWKFDDADVKGYLDDMAEVDEELRRWVDRNPAGQNLVRLAANNGLDLRFSLVSATGGPVRDNVLESRWHPRRVLDPLLWALSFDSRLRITSATAPPTEPARRRFSLRLRSH